MKHATGIAFARLERLLDELRVLPGITERTTGVFYRKSKAFLHFHEHGDELYADVRLDDGDFDRFPATTRSQQSALLRAVREALR